jgi:DNA mismatch repair protein MutS2
VRVLVGTARLEIPAEQVSTAAPAAPGRGAAPARPPARVQFDLARRADAEGARVDLRGLRVDEGLERLERTLDEAAARGTARVVVVHGLGTGALRGAVREHLAASPYVLRAEDAAAHEGGDGVTVAVLAEP